MSEEQKTDGATEFSSMLMHAFWQACLTIAFVFCRGVLIDVWNTNFSFLPSLALMPSGPFFQPPASSIWLALSTLNSHLVVLETNRSGLLTKLPVATPVRP